MMPKLVELGPPTPWPVIPPGIHDVSLDEVEATFATTTHRRWLFGGFVRAVDALRRAGCRTVYLGGSFTTGKPYPGDFDGCWESSGMDFTKLDPVLKIFFPDKQWAQEAKYFGVMFPAHRTNEKGFSYLRIFQNERFSGKPKGILRIELGQYCPNLQEAISGNSTPKQEG